MSRLSYPRPSTRRPLVHLPHVVHSERVIRSDQQHALRLRLGLLDLALLHDLRPLAEGISRIATPVLHRLPRILLPLVVVLVRPVPKRSQSGLAPCLVKLASPQHDLPRVDRVALELRLRHYADHALTVRVEVLDELLYSGMPSGESLGSCVMREPYLDEPLAIEPIA